MATLEKNLKEGRARPKAAPAAAETAAGCADDMMQRLLSEGAEASETRRQGVPAGSSGGLLDALLPAGPPLSFAPQGSSTVVVSAESVTRETQKIKQKTPEVKRVVVREENQPGASDRETETRRDQTGSVQRAELDRGSREVTGKGRGSGSESRGIGSRELNTPENRDRSHGRELLVSRHKVEGTSFDEKQRVEHYYIGEPQRLGDVVNPFWSQERQREAIASFGLSPIGQESGLLGNVGSRLSTPQKDEYVEMDPIELFRLRCIREAEERFRQGLMQMRSLGNQSNKVEESKDPPMSSGSQNSFESVVAEPENFVPPPPPGPPPPTPPRETQEGCKGSSLKTPVLPPFPAPPAGSAKGLGVTSSNLGMAGENPTESLRTVDLPKLAMESTGLQFGDWLSVIDSMMGDLSYSSGEDQCYQKWLSSSPIERLRLKPSVDSRAQSWPRTERRALAMLLNSVPEQIKEELIATRRLTTDQVLYRLCIIFQPGGAFERTKILQSITDSKCSNTLQDVLDWIRLWRRQVQRAQELGVSIPDGLVLLGALGRCTDLISGKSPQVAYRLNMVRQQLNVDQAPELGSILSFSEHLQAEAEELVLSGISKGTSAVRAAAMGVVSDVPPPPPGIPQGDSNPKPPSKKGTCKYWMGERGCSRGDTCKFFHTPLDPQSNRCFNCSAVGHTRAECPLKAEGKGWKPDPKRKVAKSSKSQGKGTSNKGNGGDKQSDGKGDQKGQNNSESQGSGGNQPPNTTKEEASDLLNEATSLLKSLKPQTKTIRLKRVGQPDGPTGLLDGGATHPLRRGSPQELANSETVLVELAHGAVELKQHPITGTILTGHTVEPIVPLRGLIDLGFVIKWGPQGCEIKHPSRGTINCWLRNGCPVVSENHALGLIQDIAAMETAKRIPNEKTGPIAETVVDWWSKKFLEVPKRIWGYMNGQGEEPSGLHLPWNRAQRRRHAQAKALIIHLFAGESSKEWLMGWPSGVEVITVDVRDGQNLHHSATWAYLWALAGSGKTIAVFGGPPCRTVSRLLERQPGPPRLRGRDGLDRFGFDHLSPQQQQKTDGDTALFLKHLGLFMHAEESWDESRWPQMKQVGNRVGFLLESPQDPETYLGNGEGKASASFWAWEETKGFQEKYRSQGMMIQFDQGLFGHPRRKPTGCMTNLPDLGELDGCRTGVCESSLAENLDDRLHQTASWSLWAPGFQRAVRTSLMILLGWYELLKPKISKSLGLEQWKQHIAQGHQPFRRDCRTCVLNMAGAKPHRRRENPGTSAWTMSVDLVHLPVARDLATKRVVKYGLIATALVPVFDVEPPKEETPNERNLDTEVVECVDPDWGEGLDEGEYPLTNGDEEVDEPHKERDGGNLGDSEYEPTEFGDSYSTWPPRKTLNGLKP